MIDYNEYLNTFNGNAAKDKIIDWIKEKFKWNPSPLAIVGISFQPNDYVTAKLCVEALGQDNVFGIFMPIGKTSVIQNASDFIHQLGIKVYTHNILEEYIDSSSQLWTNLYEDNKLPTRRSNANLLSEIRSSVLRAYSYVLNGYVICSDTLTTRYIGYEVGFGDFAPLAKYTTDEVIAIGRALDIEKDLLNFFEQEHRLNFTYKDLNEYIRLNQIENNKEEIDRKSVV